MNKPLTLATIALSATVLLASPPKPVETFAAKVVGVSDGDTIKVLRGREQVTIRLETIDAPEAKQSYGNRSWGRLVFARLTGHRDRC